MSEWKKVKLGEVCSFQNGKKRKCTYGEYPVYGGNGVLGYSNEYNAVRSIIIGRVGAYCGSIHYSEKCWVSDNAIKVDSFYNNTSFLYYLFFTLNLNKRHIGTSQPLLTQEILNNIGIYLPPLDEQKAIADVLSSLDDKIELNNKINKNLESQAQALFKRWFVDFDFPDENGNPYKSSGGEMEGSELGEIPKGWEVVAFEKLCKAVIGGDWGKEKEEGSFNEKVMIIRGADIPEVAVGGKGKCPIRFINKRNLVNKKLSQWQIIVEISGGSPTQSTGRSALITNDFIESCELPLICTNFCRSIELYDDKFAPLLYLSLQNKYKENKFFSYENGTTGIKNLDLTSLLRQELMPIPNQNLVGMFTDFFKNLQKQVFQHEKQNQKLAEMRDYLLPKLMSGEIKVN